jgi:hypothetical protein
MLSRSISHLPILTSGIFDVSISSIGSSTSLSYPLVPLISQYVLLEQLQSYKLARSDPEAGRDSDWRLIMKVDHGTLHPHVIDLLGRMGGVGHRTKEISCSPSPQLIDQIQWCHYGLTCWTEWLDFQNAVAAPPRCWSTTFPIAVLEVGRINLGKSYALRVGRKMEGQGRKEE